MKHALVISLVNHPPLGPKTNPLDVAHTPWVIIPFPSQDEANTALEVVGKYLESQGKERSFVLGTAEILEDVAAGMEWIANYKTN